MQRRSVRPAVGPMLVLLMLTAVLDGAITVFAAGTPTFTIPSDDFEDGTVGNTPAGIDSGIGERRGSQRQDL